MPTVTALRERGGGVAVDLDGGPWRTLPLDVVARAGLSVGLELDRSRLRLVRRELRRAEALAVAGRALRARDLSQRALGDRLAARVAPVARDEAVAALVRAGAVNDRRVAENRAAALAERGYGDAAIRFDLERHGLAGELVEGAVAALVPERDRARQLVERRGVDPKTARWLAGRGFDAASVEDAIGPFAEDG
jgi:SOS response regulatory protein OraA/RecX